MVIVVSGGAVGIGRAIVNKFKEKSAVVYALFCHSQKEAEELHNVGVNIKRCDVRKAVDCKRAIAGIVKEAGRIDVLINNAGVSVWGLVQDYTEAEIADIIDTNLIGTINLTAKAVPYMIEQKRGSIINIGSYQAEKGASCESVYAAAKGGINAFTKSLAMELGPSGIRVNAVAPGFIKTKMNGRLSGSEVASIIESTPLGREGEPEDVAECVYLLSQMPFVTGQILTVDGGLSL